MPGGRRRKLVTGVGAIWLPHRIHRLNARERNLELRGLDSRTTQQIRIPGLPWNDSHRLRVVISGRHQEIGS